MTTIKHYIQIEFRYSFFSSIVKPIVILSTRLASKRWTSINCELKSNFLIDILVLCRMCNNWVYYVHTCTYFARIVFRLKQAKLPRNFNSLDNMLGALVLLPGLIAVCKPRFLWTKAQRKAKTWPGGPTESFRPGETESKGGDDEQKNSKLSGGNPGLRVDRFRGRVEETS